MTGKDSVICHCTLRKKKLWLNNTHINLHRLHPVTMYTLDSIPKTFHWNRSIYLLYLVTFHSTAYYLVLSDDSAKFASQLTIQHTVQIYHRLGHTVVLWTHKVREKEKLLDWNRFFSVSICFCIGHLDQRSFNSTKHLNIPFSSGWILEVKPSPIRKEE